MKKLCGVFISTLAPLLAQLCYTDQHVVVVIGIVAVQVNIFLTFGIKVKFCYKNRGVTVRYR